MKLPHKTTVYSQFVRQQIIDWRGQGYAGTFNVHEAAASMGLRVTGNFRRQLHGLAADGLIESVHPHARKDPRRNEYQIVYNKPQELPF